MIKSFKCKETEKNFKGKFSKNLPNEIQYRVFKKLHAIDVSEDINDLRIPPSNHLELLLGDRKGQYSIMVNDQYRICFEWIDDNALNVEIVDYHN
jgi:proteic killer suppression protein